MKLALAAIGVWIAVDLAFIWLGFRARQYRDWRNGAAVHDQRDAPVSSQSQHY